MKKYPIKQIIRDAVHQYGGEPFHNIIINDLDEMGLDLLEYRYDTPLFLIPLLPGHGQLLRHRVNKRSRSLREFPRALQPAPRVTAPGVWASWGQARAVARAWAGTQETLPEITITGDGLWRSLPSQALVPFSSL